MEQYSEGDAVGMKSFHISTKGIDRSLFRTPADYQKMLNIIAIWAEKFNIPIYAYCLMSNHIHLAVGAPSEQILSRFINYIKRIYSRYYASVYGESGIFDRVSVSIKELTSVQYLKNCIAYILRNPVEARICQYADQYLWSSYGYYFKPEGNEDPVRAVNSMPKRNLRSALGSRSVLCPSKLLLSSDGNLLPESFLEVKLVEELFKGSRDELSKSISTNPYLATEYELASPVKARLPLYELVKVASELAQAKYNKNLSILTLEERKSLAIRLYRDYHASPYEITQVVGLFRKTVYETLGLQLETSSGS